MPQLAGLVGDKSILVSWICFCYFNWVLLIHLYSKAYWHMGTLTKIIFLQLHSCVCTYISITPDCVLLRNSDNKVLFFIVNDTALSYTVWSRLIGPLLVARMYHALLCFRLFTNAGHPTCTTLYPAFSLCLLNLPIIF